MDLNLHKIIAYTFLFTCFPFTNAFSHLPLVEISARSENFEQPVKIPDSLIGCFVDSTKKLNVNAVIRMNRFNRYSSTAHRFNPHFNYWFSIEFRNNTENRHAFYLFGNEWENSFWEASKNELIFRGETGVFYQKIHDNFYSGQNNDSKLEITLPPHSNKTIYIKTIGEIGKIQFKEKINFYFCSKNRFNVTAKKDLVVISVFMGISLVMLLINFISGFFYREKGNVFYLFFVLSNCLFIGGYYKFFWFLNAKINFDSSIFFPCTVLFYLLFCGAYLDFKKKYAVSWQINRILVFVVLCFLFMLTYLYFTSVIRYYYFLPKINTFFALLIIPVVYLIVRTKGKLKYFVLSALFFGTSGAVITAISLHSEILTSSYHFTLTGTMLEMMSFLCGLIYKMNITKKQAEELKHKAIEEEKERKHLTRLNKLMEEKHLAEVKLKNNELISLSLQMASQKDVLNKVHQQLGNNGEHKIDPGIVMEIKSQLKLDDDWKAFRIRFEKIHPVFFKKLLSEADSLTEYDLRLASLLCINLDTVQICQLLNLSQRSVQTSKYRLKKKLKLSRETDLKDFLQFILTNL